MYSTLGDQTNFLNATQGADALVNAFDAAIANLVFDNEDEDGFVYVSDYNALVERFNRLAQHTAWLQQRCAQLSVEDEQARRRLAAVRGR
ncbi:hypothetical protein [Aquabacterium sp. OR-4]|uniref:hypothetical protein n=1 Tax=Aquabacterium sp. OR-4 TaxID=2978127 RepID=UPI0021B444DD|nr:hypothetical protein [Aquabacterium sp. OR-4]MDT7834116.1 hypothetical protein [Aquabacterium sp. OR-4]